MMILWPNILAVCVGIAVFIYINLKNGNLQSITHALVKIATPAFKFMANHKIACLQTKHSLTFSTPSGPELVSRLPNYVFTFSLQDPLPFLFFFSGTKALP